MSMTARRLAYLSFLAFIFTLGCAAGLFGGQADKRGGSASDQPDALHATSSVCLYESVQAHSAMVADARRQVANFFDAPAVKRQMTKLGLKTAELQQRVAALTDAEIFTLQSQVMPSQEMMRTAGMENRTFVPILAGVLAGVTVATFMFLY